MGTRRHELPACPVPPRTPTATSSPAPLIGFAHNQANRLTSATIGGATSTYVYDGDGKRTSKTVGGTTTNYLYDVNRALPVFLDDGSRKYAWGLGLAYAVTTSGAIEVYHTDGLSSVRAVSHAFGRILQTPQRAHD